MSEPSKSTSYSFIYKLSAKKTIEPCTIPQVYWAIYSGFTGDQNKMTIGYPLFVSSVNSIYDGKVTLDFFGPRALFNTRSDAELVAEQVAKILGEAPIVCEVKMTSTLTPVSTES